MKYALPVLLAALLAAAAPAMADNDHGRGGGGWHGGGGEARGGNGEGRGGRWGGGQGQPGRGGAPDGRWNGGYPGGGPGPIYVAPPRGRVMAAPEPYREQDEARDGVRSGWPPMGQILRRLERSHAGRMLDAQLEQGPGGRPVYRVIWAGADGRRSDFIIDAQSGAILQGY